jgi:hypothetical protein
MAQDIRFKLAVVVTLEDNTEELMAGAIDPFDPKTFQRHMKECELELAHGRKLLDEVSRKLVIEIDFDSTSDLNARMREVHNAFKTGECFDFEYQVPTVVHAEVQLPREGSFDKAKVFCIFSNGSQKQVFDFFSDELSFRTEEFIGLTEEECSEVFRAKDVAYLSTP